MATEIANAYIALYTKMPGVKEDIEESLGGSPVQKVVGKAGEGMGTQLMDGLGKIGKAGTIALGGALALGVGGALVKGFQRLDSLDQAESKLRGLGHSGETVDKIMNDALASVKGTAFGMDEAATTAASSVAAGIKPGADLQRTLKLVADAATIAGVDMASMGSIVNKVATSDMMQMDVANQLMDAGIPILQMLGDTMGITADEARKMASEGKISFEDFQTALDSGLGGAALESGSTFSGAMDNVMASLGRMGAGLLEGIFPDMKAGLGGLMDVMAPLEEKAKELGAGFKVAFEWVKDNWDWLEPFAIAIGIVSGALVALNIVMWILSINPITLMIMAIVVALVLLIGGIILLVKNWDAVIAWIVDVWSGFVSWLGDVWSGFVSWLGEVWEGFVSWIGDVWQGFTDWIMSVIDGFVSWWNSIWEAVGSFFTDIWEGFISWVTEKFELFMLGMQVIGQAISDWWNGLWSGIASFLIDVWNNIVNFVTTYIAAVQLIIAVVGAVIASTWNAIWSGISSFFIGIWNGIMAAIQNVQNVFQSVFAAIGGFIVGAFQNAVGVVRGAINGIIDLVNGAIRAINGVVGTVGGALGFSVTIPSIPRLAEGGIVRAQRGGILANIGEGRYDEAVVPLSPAVLSQLGGNGKVEQNNTIYVQDRDERVVLRKLGRELKAAMA